MNVFTASCWTNLLVGTVAQAAASDASESTAQNQAAILEIVFSGGIFGLLIILVLVGLSISAAYLLFDQSMALRRKELLPDGVAETVKQSLLTGRIAEADAACRRVPSVLSVVILSGLAEIDFGWREVEKAVEDSLVQQANRLMRRIEYLSVIGNIAPMVGLLGTVAGMIFAFQQVAMTRGAAGAGELAEGIYQALVTTVGGLIVAIPSLAIYAVCRNRVDSMIAEVAYQSQLALTPIKRRPTRSSRTNAGQVSANQAPISKPQNDAQSSSEANTVVGIQDSMRRAKTRKSPPRDSKE